MTVFRTVIGAALCCAIVACASTATPEAHPPAEHAAMADAAAETAPVAAPAAGVIEAAPMVEPQAVKLVAPVVVEQPKVQPAKPKPTVKTRVTPPAKGAPAPTTVSLSGRLELVATGRDGVNAGEVADGLVYFLPKGGSLPPKPATFSVDTRSKGFSPAVLVIPVGSTVRFPNRDGILHNVFSRTPGSEFDLGYYGPGETKQRVFSKPGLVIVNCNVHHNMRADVVVLGTPYYTRPDRNGHYSLAGLPVGAGTLVFWHPRADAQSVTVTLPMTSAVNRKLVAIRASWQANGGGH